jgi:hypothetical protein
MVAARSRAARRSSIKRASGPVSGVPEKHSLHLYVNAVDDEDEKRTAVNFVSEATQLFNAFIHNDAPSLVNLSAPVRERTEQRYAALVANPASIVSAHRTRPRAPLCASYAERCDALRMQRAYVDLFEEARAEIYQLMDRDTFPRFKQSALFHRFLHENQAALDDTRRRLSVLWNQGARRSMTGASPHSSREGLLSGEERLMLMRRKSHDVDPDLLDDAAGDPLRASRDREEVRQSASRRYRVSGSGLADSQRSTMQPASPKHRRSAASADTTGHPMLPHVPSTVARSSSTARGQDLPLLFS